ncbi:MAG: metallophosphoesterase, partial [Acidobacteria bacterium]|nr:metallophosphoesterase [Acidobacteriota bacterium]
EVRDILASDPPPRFIVYLGDLPVHSDSATDEVLEDIGEVLRGLRTLAQSAPTPVPLLYLPGNNDSLWGDYCEFSDDDRVPEPPYTKDDGHSLDWPMINGGSCARVGSGAEACLLDSTHRLDGYYSAYPMKDHRLRVLMMNSVMFTGTTCFNSDHPWNDRKDEGDRQLAWLGDQLESARQNGEKVLIGMHIPPGKDLYCKDGEPHRGQMWQDPAQQKTFLDHVETYQPEIVGVLTSHTHMDEIRILHGSKGPVELAFSAPGISPNHSQNPGLKLVTFDADRELTDVTTYHTTLPLSASNGWQDHYTFRAAYSCTDADETLWDCAKRQSQAQLYNGLKQTLQVGRGQPTCDVSGLMEVDYPGT